MRAGVINAIVGGLAGGGDSKNSRKGYVRSLHVNSIGVSSRFGQSVTFNDDDLDGVSLPHDDALVITGDIADFDVRKVLVDTSSVANVMSWEAFKGLKIPTDQLRGDQLTSKRCYVDNIHHEADPTVLMIEKNEFQQAQRFEPAEEGTADLPGVDPSIVQHRLNNMAGLRPVKQRKRQFAPERQQAIKEELEKLLEAGFIREVKYPQWLANVVLVKKSNGKWRLCIDFTDLNKACPKDCFHLPRIDALIDATARKKRFSFLDAFSGYHQISLAPEDAEKTSFITNFGTFCYTAMPFGLKNAGATYQRMVNKVFGNLIGRARHGLVWVGFLPNPQPNPT
ncbi:Ribonuclease H [Abeliophyllum distichum]|uniref:Ribonuclease H n=1 Tax=Abeliophyllum distichum TaxID=126358 RepID=A0ABD1P0F8_9LAMI